MKRLLVSARVPLAGAPAAVAVVFAAALLVGAPSAYAANTLYVNASKGVDSSTCGTKTRPCETIGQAVANASGGDTIKVAAGTYDESVSIYTDDLTLEGAQTGNPGSAARASEDPATESVVTGGPVSIEASNVTIDGFSFGYAGLPPQVYANGPGETLADNIFSGYQSGPYYLVTAAIGVTAPDTTIIGNYFTSPDVDYGDVGGAVVQWYNGGCSGADVSGNTFYDAAASALSDIYFYCVGDSGDSAVTVSGNRDTENNSSFAIFLGMGGPVDVTNNTVSMVTANAGTGIIVDGGENSGAVDVSGNTLTGSPYRALKINPYNGSSPGPFTITGNNFAGNGVGVYVGPGALVSGAQVHVTHNDLANESGDGDAATGVSNGSEPIDATDNWWGCNAGPGAPGCSTVSGAVTFDPWLMLGVSASCKTGGWQAFGMFENEGDCVSYAATGGKNAGSGG